MKPTLAPADAAARPRSEHALAGERLSVRVEGLRLEAEVGVYASEHGRKQPITVSLEAEVASEAVHPEADLGHAVNYAALAETVRQVVGRQHHELLEDLAQALADTMFSDPRIVRIALKVDKLTALDDAASVGVSYERWR
ncbi:dihydroneopterin aldolase [Glycocaulis sp.]|uniref:dihydroneopterin aldolase n=1 Tax=Glycocaulis sp. TaxID=1969725 RepID=UPI003D220782